MDRLTPEERSKNMAAIHNKNTKPEVYIRKLLFSQGYRYRIGSSNIEGHPDIYMAKYNTAIFVNGCFWHRHAGCKYAYTPKSRVEFWTKKFNANVQRDATVRERLKKKHVKCLTIWECTIKQMKKDIGTEKEILKKIEGFLNSKEEYFEV